MVMTEYLICKLKGHLYTFEATRKPTFHAHTPVWLKDDNCFRYFYIKLKILTIILNTKMKILVLE